MTTIKTENYVDGSEEFFIQHLCTDESEKRFARIVGCIEEMLMDGEFLQKQTEFMEEHWQEFDNSEENKLVYTDVFHKYISVIEHYIETQLLEAIPGFDMGRFEDDLRKRGKDLEGEVFEILSTFSDFIAFKNMFLDYKAMKEGRMIDFSSDFTVSKYSLEENDV